MAAIQGQFGSSVKRGDDNASLSEDLNKNEEAVTHFDAYVATKGEEARYAQWYTPTEARSHIDSGALSTSFFGDFYNRIYVVPSALNVGNLVSSQQKHVIVWNAYLEEKTLESFSLGPQGGIYLSAPSGVSAPYEMKALRELDFVVRIETSGPPNIDSFVRFVVNGVDYDVSILGRRVVLFPFSPNWSSAMDETITARSWSILSEDGSEQTGSESGEVPRRSLEFSVNLRSSMQAQKFENLLFAWHARFFGVPHWGEEQRIDEALAPGDAVISVDTFGMSIEVGSLVCLYYDDEINEIREVEFVSSDSVTLTAAVDRYWPEGSRLYPCFIGLLNEEMSDTRETSTIGRASVAFDFEPSVTPANAPSSDPPLEYRGKELYLSGTNWISAMPISFVSDARKVDLNTGKIYSFTSSGFSRMSRKHAWNFYDKAEIFDFRLFLGRRQGVARSVYMPSGTEDFIMAAPILDNENILTVRKNEYGNLAGAHPARRDILILLEDGSYFCRRVQSTSDFSEFTRLELDSALGQEVHPEDVARISFLTLYRLQSPSTTIRYLADSVATSEVTLQAKTTED